MIVPRVAKQDSVRLIESRVFLFYYLGLSVVVILFIMSSGFVLLLLWNWVCIGKACMCSLEMKLACLNLKAVCTPVVLGSLKFDCQRSLVPLKGHLTLKVTNYSSPLGWVNLKKKKCIAKS